MKDNEIDVIFLIDRSGSMYGSEDDTIGGFNSLINEHKTKEINSKITTILFDHGYEVLYERKPVYEVGELTRNEYYVRGSTVLLDAIGKTITTMDRQVNDKVLFVIITDGYENSSVEFKKDQIRNMIQNHNWEFLYLGADLDSFADASDIGIKQSHSAVYKKSKKGFEDAFESVRCASERVLNNMVLDESWKSNLEN